MTQLCPIGALFVALTAIMAVMWDLLYRRIPNSLTAVVFALWLAALAGTFFAGWRDALHTPGLLFGTICALAVLAAGYVLFSLRAVGAGDVKLAAVLCLWMGNDAVIFLLATSMAGGLFILQLPLLRRMEAQFAILTLRLAAFVGVSPRSAPAALTGDCPHGLPYAPAIAVGAIFTMLRAWL